MTDEHLAIGLFGGGGEGPFFFISENRLKLLKEILHPNTFLAVQRHLKTFRQKIELYNKQYKEPFLFDPHYSVQEFENLNKITNGSIKYAMPVIINDWLDIGLFYKLIQEILGDKPKDKSTNRKNFYLKWRAYYRSANCAHYQRDLFLRDLSKEIGMDIRLDLSDPARKSVVKAMDFDLSPKSVSRKRYEIELLSNVLKNYKVTIVYPSPLTKSGRELLQSTKATLKHLSFVNFRDFKDNP